MKLEIFVKSEKHKSKEANVLTKGLNKIIQKKTTKFERQKTLNEVLKNRIGDAISTQMHLL